MDRDELTELIEGEVNEWRATAEAATNVADALEQARDALDAELTAEALQDAINNFRLMDYSGPASEKKRIEELDRIETALDDALSDAQDDEARHRDIGAALLDTGTPEHTIQRGDSVVIHEADDHYGGHGATVLSTFGALAVITLDNDTVPMPFPISSLRVRRQPFAVGVTDPPRVLRRFNTEDEAAAFINTLEGANDGVYFLDGPSDD